jgi:hypothetical protein
VLLLDEVLTPPTALAAAAPTRESRSLPPRTSASGRRDIRGWLGIGAGAAVFVAALVLQLDDPVLIVALMLTLRGGRTILDADLRQS